MTSTTDVAADSVENGIAWVKYNRPEKRNCMNPTLNRCMLEVLDGLEFRDGISRLVLTGKATAQPRFRTPCF